MKQSIKSNNKGFTLVELIAVVVIISVISVMSFASLTKTIKNSQIKEIEVFETNLKTAAQVYVETNLTKFPELDNAGGHIQINASTLITEKYLDKDIDNPSKCNLNDTFLVALKTADNTIEYAVYCTGDTPVLPTTYPVYAKGTAVYFNPVTGATCTAGEAVSTTGTKTGCMKWYAFNDGGALSDTINLILDHNTSTLVAWNSTGSNISGPTNVLTQLQTDTSLWTGVPTRSDSYSVSNGTANYTINYSTYKARLIKAAEIATITGNSKFVEATTSYANDFYFDSNNQTQTATTIGASNYDWLFDYTHDCTSYGCNIAGEDGYGYWTSTAVAVSIDTPRAWYVARQGALSNYSVDYKDAFGVRPVITIQKSNLYNPVITGATNTTIYTTNSTFNVMDGVTAIDSDGKTISVQTTSNLTLGVAGTYTVTYTATGSSGNKAAVTRTITIVPETQIVYANGTAVYFNPVTGAKCTAGEAVSTTGTKTGCMKWYAFNDGGLTTHTIDLILDHNTTATVLWNSTGSNVSGPSEIMTQLTSDTSSWSGVPTRTDSYSVSNGTATYTINYSTYKARLITASEIATIAGNTGFNETTAVISDWFWFGSNSHSSSTTLAHNYAWLFDYTNGCTSYGCNIADASNYGYWTSTAVSGSTSETWRVYWNGGFGSEGVNELNRYGLRPVITINKMVIQ